MSASNPIIGYELDLPAWRHYAAMLVVAFVGLGIAAMGTC
jgi:hypothetical protein